MRNRNLFLPTLASVALAGALAMLTSSAVVNAAEDEAGNNLSVPVIWGEAASALPLRGTFGVITLNGATYDLGGVIHWLQGDPDNEWQAESVLVSTDKAVDTIDWGDNLEARPWRLDSVVRCEVVLYKALTLPMLGYQMTHLEGEGTTEVWGTTGAEIDAYEATMYSGCAQFTIQKLPNADPTSIWWDTTNKRWAGDVGPPLFQGGVWEGGDGPGGYSAEINNPGKVIYGYNWFLRDINDGEGFYRLTFHLNSADCPYVLGLDFDGNTVVKPAGEVTTVAAFAGNGQGNGQGSGNAGGNGGNKGNGKGGGKPIGGAADLDPTFNITWIDVQVKPGTGNTR